MSNCEQPELPLSQYPVGAFYLQTLGDDCKTLWMRVCEGTDKDWIAFSEHCVVCGDGEPDAEELAGYPTGSYYVDQSNPCSPHVWVNLSSCGLGWFDLCKTGDSARIGVLGDSETGLLYPVNSEAETPIPFVTQEEVTVNTNEDKFEFNEDGQICVKCKMLVNVTLSMGTDDLIEDDCKITIGININGAFAGRNTAGGTCNTLFPYSAPIFYLPNVSLEAGDCVGAFAFASDGKEFLIDNIYVAVEEVG